MAAQLKRTRKEYAGEDKREPAGGEGFGLGDASEGVYHSVVALAMLKRHFKTGNFEFKRVKPLSELQQYLAAGKTVIVQGLIQERFFGTSKPFPLSSRKWVNHPSDSGCHWGEPEPHTTAVVGGVWGEPEPHTTAVVGGVARDQDIHLLDTPGGGKGGHRDFPSWHSFHLNDEGGQPDKHQGCFTQIQRAWVCN